MYGFPSASERLFLTSRAGVTEDSGALVPGDIVDVAEPSLHTFPADLVLLSGDAIVNESMLTGESVPVSKIPVESDGVSLVSHPGGEVHAELSRHVVFCGTKIVRVRKTAPVGVGGGGPEALGMVMRTGEFGLMMPSSWAFAHPLFIQALTRPRELSCGRCSSLSPLGEFLAVHSHEQELILPLARSFAFYRDSFRFIGVLALVALTGFLGSCFNFVKLGVSPYSPLRTGVC